MARTGSSTVSTATRVFQSDRNAGGQVADGPPAGAIQVTCVTGSAVSLLVRIPSIHGASATATLAAGESRIFTQVMGPARIPGIHELYLTGSSGTATYTFECIA
jgi:hypothetical protein